MKNQHRERAVTLYETTDMTATEVATVVGVTRHSVMRWCAQDIEAGALLALKKHKKSICTRRDYLAGVRSRGGDFLAKMKDRWGDKNPNWRGDMATISAKYTRARRRVELRGTCEVCDKPAQVRHHRNEVVTDNRADNIAMMCRACHASHHHGSPLV